MTVQPLTITKAEAIPIILAGHAARELPAQNSLSGTYYQKVHDKVIRCAIGLLYPEEQAKELEGSGPTASYQMAADLIKGDLLVVDDAAWFIRIQAAHDNWSDAGDDPEDRAVFEGIFLELLQ